MEDGRFSIQQQGLNTYLVYEMGGEDHFDSVARNMMNNNEIKGITPLLVSQFDSTIELKYNISSKISLTQLFSGKVIRKTVLEIFGNITSAVLETENYMIEPSSFIMDTDYIYAEVSTNRVSMICLPLEAAQNDGNWEKFFRNIIMSLSPDPNDPFGDMSYVAKIISYLNSGTFTVQAFDEQIKNMLKEQRGGRGPAPVQQSNQNISQKPKPQAVDLSNVTPPNPGKAPVAPAKVEIPPVQNRDEQPEKKKELLKGLFGDKKGKEKESEKPEKKTREKPAKEEKEKEKKKGLFHGKEPVAEKAPDMGFAIPGQKREIISAPVAPSTDKAKKAAESAIPAYTQPAVQSAPAASQVQYKSGNFGGTTVLNNANGGTTVLVRQQSAPEAKTKAMLIRKKNNERIALRGNVFRIGKEPTYADYVVADNPYVGRSHAEIHARDGEYFVFDNNSKNHTYVNGEQIQSNIEILINPGDTLEFANEVFRFVIE